MAFGEDRAGEIVRGNLGTVLFWAPVSGRDSLLCR